MNAKRLQAIGIFMLGLGVLLIGIFWALWILDFLFLWSGNIP